jgi:hypothetical protein
LHEICGRNKKCITSSFPVLSDSRGVDLGHVPIVQQIMQ